MGFTVIGVYLIAKHALGLILERRRRWELHKRYVARSICNQILQSIYCGEQMYSIKIVVCVHFLCLIE